MNPVRRVKASRVISPRSAHENQNALKTPRVAIEGQQCGISSQSTPWVTRAVRLCGTAIRILYLSLFIKTAQSPWRNDKQEGRFDRPTAHAGKFRFGRGHG